MKTVNLALQGGGALGSFTWGVLDRLLDEESIDIEGAIGTSAGAMNAACLISGLTVSKEKAKENLTTFWNEVSKRNLFNPAQFLPHEKNSNQFRVESNPFFMASKWLTDNFSPYQLNPTGENPLTKILDGIIDFEAIQNSKKHKLFIAATYVTTGRVKIFSNPEITHKSLAASGCLPTLFQAVEIDGEMFWDGGFIANPAVFPLIYKCSSPDIIIVPLNTAYKYDIPKTAAAIRDRQATITMNSSLLRELRTIQMMETLIDNGVEEKGYKKVNLHMISNDQLFSAISHACALSPDEDLIRFLFNQGRSCANSWLEANFKDIGKQSTYIYRDEFLESLQADD